MFFRIFFSFPRKIFSSWWWRHNPKTLRSGFGFRKRFQIKDSCLSDSSPLPLPISDLCISVSGVWVWDLPERRTRGSAGEQDQRDQSNAQQPQQDHWPWREGDDRGEGKWGGRPREKCWAWNICQTIREIVMEGIICLKNSLILIISF